MQAKLKPATSIETNFKLVIQNQVTPNNTQSEVLTTVAPQLCYASVASTPVS